MRFIDEYRDPALGRGLTRAIADAVQPGRRYHLMEFCGGHTHAIAQHGLADLLPEAVRLIHGPGCPVCVLPVGRLDMALALARSRPDVILCTYGDLMRVPASGGDSLYTARAAGADVRMVYSTLDALAVARANPHREVVFLAIGFETTTPPTALALVQAEREGLRNLSVFCNHVLTPPAIVAILADTADAPPLDGIIGPAHVSTVIGSDAYAPCAARFGVPVVIAGFEPLDVLRAIVMLMAQINAGRATVETEYTRAVTATGNRTAQALMEQVFTVRESFEWRGLGALPASALRIRDAYAAWDAEARFSMPPRTGREHPACACGSVLRGALAPHDCRLFGRACTPERPQGACMVSSEGACAAAWTRRPRLKDARPKDTRPKAQPAAVGSGGGDS
ncbi:hydrogenase formation protein HypD [Roseospira marina]|uniref:Hydrogenase maturation factor n=1 Tax=Roseospira marina TaxID=140057 RepID=A0A5M6IDB3_9PROT|nr:hydrogenase formation protein HypD [Roseospira marina]KAA5606270.1 hydrogenase formation protein HypD [Roseospira marina]MBB4314427.1 hydrogenase expression/formation protein HypD [Roseospira marina]MBB5087587.1 hydrogenase expression/formation protein HypD [Roseospira marina]